MLAAILATAAFLSFSPQSFAASATAFQSQLDVIEEKIAQGDVSESLYAELENIISKEPTNYRAYLLLGNCYDFLALPELSQEQYELATRYGPNEPKAFVELIKSQIRMGQIKSAMALLDQARRKFPKDPEVQFWVGNYLLSKNRFSEAETAYVLALQQKKKILGLSTSLGEIRLAQGRYGEAYFLADADLAIQKNYALANRVKGLALMKLGRYEQAMQPLRIAYFTAQFKPNLAASFAKCCFWSGRYSDALNPALVNLALTSSMDSNNPVEKNFLVSVIKKVPDDYLRKVVDHLQKTLGKAFPASYHFALGDVLDRVNKPELAVAQYKLGLEREPSFARGWLRLGQDLEKHYRSYDQALSCYKMADGFKPGDAEITSNLYRLSNKLANRSRDWSWQLKDLFHPAKGPIELPTLQKAQTTDSRNN